MEVEVVVVVEPAAVEAARCLADKLPAEAGPMAGVEAALLGPVVEAYSHWAPATLAEGAGRPARRPKHS